MDLRVESGIPGRDRHETGQQGVLLWIWSGWPWSPPGPDWPEVVAALLDGIDLVVVAALTATAPVPCESPDSWPVPRLRRRRPVVRDAAADRPAQPTYDTGFVSAGSTTHEPFDPHTVRTKMRVIRVRLRVVITSISTQLLPPARRAFPTADQRVLHQEQSPSATTPARTLRDVYR